MNDEQYEKEKDDLKKFRKSIEKYAFGTLIFWAILFFGFFFWWLLKEIIPISNTGFSLKSLGSMGGAFNIVIALTGVLTVWLLAKAVSFQKEELIDIKKQMFDQKETTKDEEKINRTIDLIYKWTSLYSDFEESFTRGSSKASPYTQIIHLPGH